MSADEFDPEIERLFGRAPQMPDSALFTAQIEQRLQKGSRVRVLALGLGLGIAAVGGGAAGRSYRGLLWRRRGIRDLTDGNDCRGLQRCS